MRKIYVLCLLFSCTEQQEKFSSDFLDKDSTDMYQIKLMNVDPEWVSKHPGVEYRSTGRGDSAWYLDTKSPPPVDTVRILMIRKKFEEPQTLILEKPANRINTQYEKEYLGTVEFKCDDCD